MRLGSGRDRPHWKIDAAFEAAFAAPATAQLSTINRFTRFGREIMAALAHDLRHTERDLAGQFVAACWLASLLRRPSVKDALARAARTLGLIELRPSGS